MSRESYKTLNTNVLRGYTDKRGHAWHYMANEQGDEPNHYPGPIPAADVRRRLFNWQAVPLTLGMRLPDGTWQELADEVAWARDDTFQKLGIHSDSYKGHQYGEMLLENVATIVDESSGSDLQIASAGLLRGGAVAWVQIETPDNIETENGVTIRPFIAATTSFDGSIANTFKDGFTDIVCDNTHQMFFSEAGGMYRFKSTRNSAFDAVAARSALGILTRHTEGFLAEIDSLCGVDVSDRTWQKFIEAHVPIEDGAKGRGVTMAENKRAALTQLWNHDARVTPWRNTAWGVIQATNTYTHHIGTVRNMSRADRNMMRAVTGGVATLDREALTDLETVLGRKIEVARTAKHTIIS